MKNTQLMFDNLIIDKVKVDDNKFYKRVEH